MSNSETDEGAEHDHQDDPITHNPTARAKYLSTVVALPIALHYPALVVAAAMGLVDFDLVAQPWFLFDTLGWLAVMAYIFGEETVNAARRVMGEE